MKYCFVILHYRTLNETHQCVQHIKTLNNQQDIQIIIVDNGSKDGSILKLKELQMHMNNIFYVESEYNIGFAKGNNLGYSIAKHKFQAQYVILLNSDVFIQQKEFPEFIEELDQKTGFDILGPDIVTKKGHHQNPVGYIHENIKRVNKTIFLNRMRFLASFLPIEIKKPFKKRNVKVTETPNIDTLIGESQIENVPLHGACLILSKNFIKSHEFPFYPDTFLYAEEDILYYLGQKKREKFVFSPSLKVLHLEDASTDLRFFDYRKKKRFVIKNSTQSLKILKKLMKNQSFL